MSVPGVFLTTLRYTVLQVARLEASRRFRLQSSAPLADADVAAFAALVHDRMTEQVCVWRSAPHN